METGKTNRHPNLSSVTGQKVAKEKCLASPDWERIGKCVWGFCWSALLNKEGIITMDLNPTALKEM